MMSSPVFTPLGQADDGLSDIELDNVNASYTTGRSLPTSENDTGKEPRDDRAMWLSKPNSHSKVCKMASACFALVCVCLIILLARRKDSPMQKNENSPTDSTNNNAESNPWAAFQATSPGLGIVATDSATCSEIGVNILLIGGNAVDAAVASALCLGVISPGSSGLGGGAYILFRKSSDKSVIFFDSRETAPAAAYPRMFDADPQLSQDGGLAIATLGELKGLYDLHRDHGRLNWAACTEPSAKLAENFEVSAELAAMLVDKSVLPHLLGGKYKELSNLFLNENGSVKKEGEQVQNRMLAETLRKIGEQGSDYLYKTMATVLASEVQAVGGILHESDIKSYRATKCAPISATLMGHTMFTASGSSSGGAAVAGIVEFMNGFADPLASEGLVYDHRLVEAFNNIFAIRMSLGDPAFVNTTGPISALTSQNYMGLLRARVDDAHVLPLTEYGGQYNIGKSRRFLPTDHGTSHLSVIDKDGNAVSLTSTVNTYFGSKIVSASTGIVFNNQMDDFSNSHAPNYFGLHPSSSNLPAPFKRPLSSMSPTIIVHPSGQVRLVGGGSGGPRIITATAQVILNYLGKGFDLFSAVKAPRLHSQLLPETVYVEQHTLLSGLKINNPTAVSQSLEDRGHNLTQWQSSMGVCQFISVDPDTGFMVGVSDPRKNGQPRGVQN